MRPFICQTIVPLATLCLCLSSANAWDPLPEHPPVAETNPQTPEKVELGKKLFFDPRLSLTGTVSCNSCHNLMEGGDDGRSVSMGIRGLTGERNAPTVWNSAFQSSQFWDGRAVTLEDQAIGPIVAAPEMGMPSHDVAIERLRKIPAYVDEFDRVFPSSGLTLDSVAKAIAAFERTLVTSGNPYDRFANGEREALAATQRRGLELFENVGCTECHSGPAFNGWSSNLTEPTFVEFPRFSDSPDVAKYDLASDIGRSSATQDADDEHLFKTPTLRNINLTAPYFHNGRVAGLPEAVRVMGTTQLGEELSEAAVNDIVAFLQVLDGPFPEVTLPRLPSRDGESVIDGGKSVSKLVSFGTMHEAIGQKQHHGRVSLQEVAKEPNFYAVAALEGLQGEVTIVDGAVTVTTVDDLGRPQASPAGQAKAAMLVGQSVPRWIEYQVNDNVSASDFDEFISERVAAAGFDAAEEFIFLIEGEFTVQGHIINGACPVHARMRKLALPDAVKPYEMEANRVEGVVVGVFARDAVGRLTHPATSTHCHLVYDDPQSGVPLTCHLERIAIQPEAKLKLPARP